MIDKMEAVLPPGREKLMRAEGGDPGVAMGFLEAQHRPGLVITVLDPRQITQRLQKLKYA